MTTFSPQGRAVAADNEPRRDAVQGSLQRAVNRLLQLQHPDGWWRGELETNVTMDAEDLLFRRFLGIDTADQRQQSARWIRSQQRDDGSWANFYGGRPDLSTTVEAYVALRLAGDEPDADHMAQARQLVHTLGGLEQTRVFTRFWLALFGQYPWAEVPVLPPEQILLPARAPLSLYDFGCWARQTIAPLTILCTLRPRADLGFDLGDLRAGRIPSRTRVPFDRFRAPGWASAFAALDAFLHRYHRHPLRRVRELAMRRMASWIVERQEADGSWGGIQPPWVYSLMALHAFGYPVDHPVIARGVAGWNRFTVLDQTAAGPIRRIEACQSPVWDTALAVIALRDAQLPADHSALERAADWLVEEEIRNRGDWTVRRDIAPGGWAFEFDNDNYPDIDDTAEVVLALDRVRTTPERHAASDRGRHWVAGMQSRDGGWAAFDADNTRDLLYQLPFSDFGAVIDPPSADVTGHVLEMLATRTTDGPTVKSGLRWLLNAQEPDGSWYGRWGANYVYGTGAVVPAMLAAGLPASSEPIRRAVAWLVAHQNNDGGWGEDMRSYTDPAWRGRGSSTPSQTSWALLALLAAESHYGRVINDGIRWLIDRQTADGGWDEPYFTGTGFPGDFYINYHLYRLVFPISVLGRYLHRSAP
jgi:squalene-hopene/tetraprenyl-beta-curcumene cyclase